MLTKEDFKRVAPLLWEVPTTFQHGMRVPVRLFADERLLEAALGDKSMQQAVNASTLPGLVSHVAGADVHQVRFPDRCVAASGLSGGACRWAPSATTSTAASGCWPAAFSRGG
jgi:tRNA-splicing ligase RtcB